MLTKKRVLVIGGRGFIGSRAAAALGRVAGLDVRQGGRGSENDVHLDLNAADTFAAMDPFEYDINCTDPLAAPPDNAIAYRLRRGGAFLETTADAATMARLLKMRRDSRKAGDAPLGAIVLGVGLFPGMTNLVAHKLLDRCGDCQRIGIGVRFQLSSGAGAGMINQMASTMTRPALRYEDGALIEDPPIQVGTGCPSEASLYPRFSSDYPKR